MDAAARDAVAGRVLGDGLPLAAMIKDDERCIRCGLCAVRCPTDAMTMERFSITEQLLPPGADRVEAAPSPQGSQT
jgi:ferredoxin